MAEVKPEQPGQRRDARSSGMILPDIKEEPESVQIKEEPEPSVKPEPEEYLLHMDSVKTEEEEESSVLHQRATEENRDSDSSDHTDHSEDYSQQQAQPKRSYAMIPPDSCGSLHRPYSCSHCGRGFTRNRDLKRHMLVHTGERNHKCSFCQRVYIEKAALTKHLVRVHLICPVCEQRYSDQLKLNSHLRDHVEKGTLNQSVLKLCRSSDRRPFSCSRCGTTCRDKSELQIHLSTHTGEKPHRCTVCKETWKYKHELQRHLRKRHGLALSKDDASLVEIPEADRKPLSCSDCGKRFCCKSDLQRHTSVHTGERPFKCSICGKGFDRKPHLTKHRRSAHHVCPVCAARFPNQTKLDKHLTTHEVEGTLDEDRTRPPSCSECGKEFRFKSDLKRHMIFHTGERPYRCSVCERGFSIANDLKIHMMTHTGERPYSCSVCGKRFTGNNKLTRHQRVIHHVCPVCQSGFTSKTKLQDHLRTHDEEEEDHTRSHDEEATVDAEMTETR